MPRKLLPFLLLLLPLPLSAQCSGTHEIDLSWAYTQGSDPATGFYIFIEQQGQTKFTQLNATQLPVSALAYSDCSIGGGYSYSYYVTAVDAKGTQSQPSNTWVSAVIPVTPVSGVTVTRSSSGANTIVYTFGGDGGAATIGRSTSACGTTGATFTQIATGITATSYTDSAPPASSDYCYSVAAVINGVASTLAYGGVANPPNAATGITGRVVR